MGAPKKYLWDLFVNGVLASPAVPIGVRTRAYRALGVQVGRGVRVRHRVHLTSSKLVLGDGCYVNVGAIIQNTAPVLIGQNVAVAPNAIITTVGHDLTNPSRRQGTPQHAPVLIGDGAWIGAAATVLPGVEIGAGAMVAAGAVVTTDVDDHWLYAGVPARQLRALPGASTLNPVPAPAPHGPSSPAARLHLTSIPKHPPVSSLFVKDAGGVSSLRRQAR